MSQNHTFEHMDIFNAYVHEPAMYLHTLYLRELLQSDGVFKHGKATGTLRKILWGGRSAGHYDITALFAYLAQQGFHTSEKDSCCLYHQDASATTMLSITLDEFLVLGSTQAAVDNFPAILAQKYAVKRLGKPKTVLG